MVLGSLAFIDNLSLQRALSRLPHTDAASVVEPLWSSWTFRFGSPTPECPTQRSTLADAFGRSESTLISRFGSGAEQAWAGIYPVTWDDPIMDDEIFGPLLPILTYKDMDAAIREVKKHPKPLSGFLFSRDQKAIDHFLASLSFGGGAINQVNIHLFIETMPFGGVGYSGIGHYYGKDGFDALTHAKSVLISRPDVAIEHLFPPYTEEKVKALSQWFEY
jgi:hypothetical protein